jgi:uncharacterized protein
VRYLLDSNIWLDVITDGPNSAETKQMLQRAAVGSFATTDFAVHTMGIILAGSAPTAFARFLDDLIRHKVFTLHLAPADLYAVAGCMQTTGLDFDDAFQYYTAERFNLTIVSLDADFDRTPRGRKTPAQVLAEIGSAP